MTHWLFLAGLAWRDLTDRTARRASAVVAVTVAAGVAFALVGYGFTYGTQRVQEAKLRGDPMALCVWAGSPIFPWKLTKAEVTSVRAAAMDAGGPTVRAVSPFRQVGVRFRTASGENTASIDGRTIRLGSDGDPLFDSLHVRGGLPSAGPGTPGLFVTPDLVARLGYPPGSQPKTLKVVFRGERVEEVQVAGLIDALPFRHQFVVTETFADELFLRDIDVKDRSAFSGAIGADWPKHLDPDKLTAELPPPVTKFLNDEKLSIRWGPGPGRGLWILEAAVDRQLAEWGQLLQQLERRMAEAGKARADGFAVPELRDAPGGERPPDTFDFVAVYVTELRALEPVAKAISSLPLRNGEALPVNGEVAAQYRKVGEQTARTEKALGYVSAAVALLAGAVAFAILRLRAEHQVAETGMLRAMGMSRGSLALIAVCQGFYLWALAGVVGSAVGWWGIGVAARLLPDGDPVLGGYREPWLFAAVVGSALVVCVVSAWWAGLTARRLSPAVALGNAA